jgi:hypothetical protein
MDLLAHAAGGHWIVEVGIYLGPFLSIAAVVLFTDRRRRRREQRAAAEGTSVEGT